MKLLTSACIFSLFAGVCFAAPLQEQHPPELVSLAKEFREWTRAGSEEVPDFVQRAAEQRRGLGEFRRRLKALAPSDWSVHAKVDYLLLQLEMNALEFDLELVRQVSRNPDFYTMEAVNRVTRHIGGRYQMGPGVTVPYDAERAVGIIGALEATPAIIEQASKALTEGVPEMDMAVEKLADVRQNYAELARIVGPHLPEPHRSQVGSAAEKAGQALEEYRQWIRSNRDKMSAPYAIGRPAFEWYVQNVYVLPYDSEQLLMQAEMERLRNWAFLQFERQKNRQLPRYGGIDTPPARPARTNAEYSEWKDATDVLSRLWAEEHDLFTRPDYLGFMRNEEGGYLDRALRHDGLSHRAETAGEQDGVSDWSRSRVLSDLLGNRPSSGPGHQPRALGLSGSHFRGRRQPKNDLRPEAGPPHARRRVDLLHGGGTATARLPVR